MHFCAIVYELTLRRYRFFIALRLCCATEKILALCRLYLLRAPRLHIGTGITKLTGITNQVRCYDRVPKDKTVGVPSGMYFCSLCSSCTFTHHIHLRIIHICASCTFAHLSHSLILLFPLFLPVFFLHCCRCQTA